MPGPFPAAPPHARTEPPTGFAFHATSSSRWSKTPCRWRASSAPAMPASRSPKAWACRCRCARASSRTSSATATSRSASASTSASAAAMPAPRTSRRRRIARRRCRRPTTSPASPPRTRPPACPMPTTWPRPPSGARPRPVPPLGHRRRAGGRARAALRGRGAGHRPPHHQFRRRRRVGAAVALLGRQQPRLPRRLRQFAALPVGGADRRRGKGRTCSATAWYSSMRDAADLAVARGGGPLRRRARAVAPEARRKCHRRGAGAVRVDRGRRPAGRLRAGHLGGALYRKASFLLDSLGSRCWPHIDIDEDPHVPKGKGSAPFDDEACARARAPSSRRRRAGLLPVELLGAQARHEDHRPRRRLAEPHADQPLTRPGDDLDAMLRKLHRGLFVTELMGQGVNYVTGDYSRGAAGFWVENGRIATRCRRSPSPATCARCSRASSPSAPTPTPGLQDHRLGADRPHEAGGRAEPGPPQPWSRPGWHVSLAQG
jgi:hypothetical protein